MKKKAVLLILFESVQSNMTRHNCFFFFFTYDVSNNHYTKKSILHGDVFTCNTTYEEHFGDVTYSQVAGHKHCTVSTWTRSIEQKQSKVNKAMKVKLVQYFKKITVSKVTSFQPIREQELCLKEMLLSANVYICSYSYIRCDAIQSEKLITLFNYHKFN